MKILFFSSYFYPYTSGLTTYPYKILNCLGRNNQVEVLTFKYKDSLKNIEHIENIAITRLPYLFKVSKGFISPQSAGYFLRETQKTNLIILNIPNFEGLILAIFAKIFRKKIIAIFHCEVYLGNGFTDKIVNFFLNFSIFIQLLLSDVIVAYTEDYTKHVGMLQLFKNKLRFTLPPIDNFKVDENYLENLMMQKGKKLWIGFAGRIASEKGIEYLIEAVAKIKNKSIELIFAGPFGNQVAGEDEYYSKINNLLAGSAISYRFLDNLNTYKLAAFYKTIDLLALPSINKTEAFGMVQAEAMLQGTPVIATDMPGVRMPINLTKMGILVDSKNHQQLKNAIEQILKNRNKFTDPRLFKKAVSIFDIKKVYNFWERLINEKS